MNKLLSVDLDLCDGCRTCEMVCSLKHYSEANPARALVKLLRFEKMGEYIVTIPIFCQQCETPMCKAVCPVKAISQDKNTGAYIVDEKKCIGCRMCVAACPMGAIEVDPVKKTAVKCDLCGGDPTCVKFCSQEAIRWSTKDEVGWENRRKAAEKFSDRMKIVVIGGK
jgi:carbon-monoxide dehydrogenase iron sulfur subunit